MITEIELENFKRFRDLAAELRSLTVLTGLNGTGKSTFIQSLLLVRQAAETLSRKVVALNDVHGLALGEAWEVLHPEADKQEIGISLRHGQQVSRFRFAVPDDRSLNLTILGRPDVLPDMLGSTGSQFAYLNAERLGPRDQLSVTAEDVNQLGVGERGQYTAQVLAMCREQVDERLLHPTLTERLNGVTTLRTQVELWVSDIVRTVDRETLDGLLKIGAEWLPGLSASIIRFQESGVHGEPIRPGNTGFGLSYALPIIVAGLRMRSGGLFIVENPEAHLHPAGQSKLGRFLARLAANNVQVIVETHSDHVLNGIRAEVAEGKSVDSDEVLIHFFGMNAANETGTTPIEISPRGSIRNWPAGFFDQLEYDLGSISHAGRRRG